MLIKSLSHSNPNIVFGWFTLFSHLRIVILTFKIFFSSDPVRLIGEYQFNLQSLKEIQVSNARVSTLAKNVFNGQRNLKKLSLHNNNITDIVRGTYDFGHSVEHLGRKKLSCHL